MELSDLVRGIVHRWWIVAASVALGIAVSLGSIALTQPVYQSTVAFFVVVPTETRLSALEADNLVRARVTAYASLVTSDRFLDQIVAATGKGLTKAQAAGSISAFGDPDTLQLKVQVRDTDAARSLAMASAVASYFGALVNDLEGRSKTADTETVLNVVSGPTLAPSPVQPRKTFSLGLGVLIGLAGGLGVVIGLQRSDKSIRKEEQMGTEPPVLATMPKDAVAKDPARMMIPNSNSILNEAARRLRTSIQFQPGSTTMKVLAVTASATGDGATTTALILAKAFAETDRKVLLLEANLRTPDCAALLNLNAAPGVSEVLTGRVEFGKAVQNTANPFLDVLVAGNARNKPSELLAGGIAKLLEQLRAEYEVIVIDTAALAPWTDTVLVAAAADGTILTARHGKTTPDMMGTALTLLASVRAQVLGTVLNAQPLRRSKGQEVLSRKKTTLEQSPPENTHREARESVPTPPDRTGAVLRRRKSGAKN